MRRATIFPIGVLLLYAAVIHAQATTITVTNTNDSGPGSLRQALVDANDGDTINFAVTGTIGLTSGELAVDKSVAVSGPGPGSLTVSRNSNTSFRIFHVMPGPTVTIAGLTIRNGAAEGADGGGILNDQASLTVSDCSVVNNFAGDGGGIAAHSGQNAGLTIIDSLITGNGAGRGKYASGGGVYSEVTVTIVHTTISSNSAVGALPFNFGAGGGISAGGTIINSTISNNHAGTYGGGLSWGGMIVDSTISNNDSGGGDNHIPGAGGGITIFGGTISNCTISGNSVYGSIKGTAVGGGIDARQTVTVSNSTISGNSTGINGRGGGIANSNTLALDNDTLPYNSAAQGGTIDNGGSIAITNTILVSSSGQNIFNEGGTITSAGFNVSSDDGGGYLNGPGDQINTNPLLGQLQDNGGPTSTHELLPGSPAIDAGNPKFTPPPWYDQRGTDFWRVRNDRIDTGSFEVQNGSALTPTPTPRPTPAPRSRPTPHSRPTPP